MSILKLYTTWREIKRLDWLLLFGAEGEGSTNITKEVGLLENFKVGVTE